MGNHPGGHPPIYSDPDETREATEYDFPECPYINESVDSKKERIGWKCTDDGHRWKCNAPRDHAHNFRGCPVSSQTLEAEVFSRVDHAARICFVSTAPNARCTVGAITENIHHSSTAGVYDYHHGVDQMLLVYGAVFSLFLICIVGAICCFIGCMSGIYAKYMLDKTHSYTHMKDDDEQQV
eukprot:CAMPEP_0202688548 /NCGR_PEP_ID=MMETSP1385-20130828/4041_1 /ASSEMBLY_ACC=CAM_ASM_000861 /TAXON_ID=933848 /ORGANISM="Elphidium margaritaceum" /LENGTH=180 /DNA_ID=CAMNT_0049343543 /DNA_START=18 /DNA_END=560 /DNA_ORIENTATION=+